MTSCTCVLECRHDIVPACVRAVPASVADFVDLLILGDYEERGRERH